MRRPGHTVTSSTFISLDFLQATFSAVVLPNASQSCSPQQMSHYKLELKRVMHLQTNRMKLRYIFKFVKKALIIQVP